MVIGDWRLGNGLLTLSPQRSEGGGFDLGMRNSEFEKREEKDGEEDWGLEIGDWGLGIGDWMDHARFRGVEGKIFANEVIQINLKNRV